MSDDLASILRKKKALLEEQAAAIDRELAELAELERLAAKHNLVVTVPGHSVSQQPVVRAAAIAVSAVPLRAFSSGIEPSHTVSFDGTMNGLLQAYKNHPESPYLKLKHKVRNSYAYTLKRIAEDIGDTRLVDLDGDAIMALYGRWAEGRKWSMGHSLVGKMRIVFNFGMMVLKDEQATRLSVIMSKLRFKIPEARGERLTVEHVEAICEAAHSHFNWPSVALAQALQFELMLKQSDVCGEWVPLSEPGTSDIIKGNEKWVRGLRWSNIDQNWILRTFITGTGRQKPKNIEIDLKQAPLSLRELKLMNRTEGGPLILCEATGLPWSLNEFRRKWRMVANEAGVPLEVKNMDSGKADKPITRTLPAGELRKDGV